MNPISRARDVLTSAFQESCEIAFTAKRGKVTKLSMDYNPWGDPLVDVVAEAIKVAGEHDGLRRALQRCGVPDSELR